MKKIITTLFSALLLVLSIQQTQAMTYKEASESSTPMALFIYADWADDINKAYQTFKASSNMYNKSYNFVVLNIASEETKEFNKKFHINPNLPYVVLSRNQGKVVRFIPKNCVVDRACFNDKIKNFIN